MLLQYWFYILFNKMDYCNKNFIQDILMLVTAHIVRVVTELAKLVLILQMIVVWNVCLIVQSLEIVAYAMMVIKLKNIFKIIILKLNFIRLF
jgi:hypothetical protein